jgi:hypothetical protein
MVAEVLGREAVARRLTEFAGEADESEVIPHRKGARIEQDMVVRAEAEDIARHVGPVVGRTEGSDVRPFGVGPVGEVEP